MYRTILFGTDGSETANIARQASIDLAMRYGARVAVATAFEPPGRTAECARRAADEAVALATAKGLEATAWVQRGEPADIVPQAADPAKADLVVVGNKGMAGARRYLLGSVPNRVAHAAPTDVLIVKTVDLSVFDIQPDHGGVLDLEGRRMAVYRDPEGTVHSVSARCTHMGCTVGWNDGDKSFDCPCHGSRYDRFGHVIRGPAKADLEGAPPREAEEEPAAAGQPPAAAA